MKFRFRFIRCWPGQGYSGGRVYKVVSEIHFRDALGAPIRPAGSVFTDIGRYYRDGHHSFESGYTGLKQLHSDLLDNEHEEFGGIVEFPNTQPVAGLFIRATYADFPLRNPLEFAVDQWIDGEGWRGVLYRNNEPMWSGIEERFFPFIAFGALTISGRGITTRGKRPNRAVFFLWDNPELHIPLQMNELGEWSVSIAVGGTFGVYYTSSEGGYAPTVHGPYLAEESTP